MSGAAVPAYAMATLRDVRMGPQIVQYLERIDATLAPFAGRFLVHGGPKQLLEGDWDGDIVVIAFPSLAAAQGWYASPAYRDILALRTANARCDVVLVEGVTADHAAMDILAPAGIDEPG